jgi:excisionase family DNA binding protein
MKTDNLLSVNQVAFILRVHPLTIRRYIKDRRLKAIKVGGNVRIEENVLQDFHKDLIPQTQDSVRIFKSSKLVDRQFNTDDPLLRLQGRGASLKLS